MNADGFQKREQHSPSEEIHGIAQRALREKMPINALRLRDSDIGIMEQLRIAVRRELLAIAGLAPGQAESSKPLEPRALEKILFPEEKEVLITHFMRSFKEHEVRNMVAGWLKYKKN